MMTDEFVILDEFISCIAENILKDRIKIKLDDLFIGSKLDNNCKGLEGWIDENSLENHINKKNIYLKRM